MDPSLENYLNGCKTKPSTLGLFVNSETRPDMIRKTFPKGSIAKQADVGVLKGFYKGSNKAYIQVIPTLKLPGSPPSVR